MTFDGGATFDSGATFDPTTYVFTWGSSTWDTSSATWSSPGVYAEGAATIAATGAVVLSSNVTLIRTSGMTGAVTAAHAQSGFAAYTDPANTGVYVSATSARVWSRLPGCYRDADVTAEGNGVTFPLLRWIASLVDQAGDIEGLIGRFSPPTTSALTDPDLADPGWLPWLAQLVGVRLSSRVGNIPAARAQIKSAISGAQPGTRAGIVAAVQAILSGTKTVTVTDHYSGDPWKIQIGTLTTETPKSLTGILTGTTGFIWGSSAWDTTSATWEDPDPVLAQINQTGVKPAGYTLVHTTS